MSSVFVDPSVCVCTLITICGSNDPLPTYFTLYYVTGNSVEREKSSK